MTDKEKDPNEGLAQDAALATEIKDADARRAEQLTYYGGDPDDNDGDLAKADRGNIIGDDDASEQSGSVQDSETEVEADADDSDADDGETESEDDDGVAAKAAGKDGKDEVEEVEEAEEAEEEEEEEVEDTDKKDSGIPRHRFNEVNRRMKAAEAQLVALKNTDKAKEAAKAETYDFEVAEEKYMSLLLDGKTKEAGQLRKEIRAAEKEDFVSEATVKAASRIDMTTAERTLDSLTREAESMFPIFNQDSENFSPQAVSKTLTWMRGYQAEGMSADNAFVAALADAIEIYKLDPGFDTKSPGDKDTKGKDTKVVDIKKGKTVVKKEPIKKVAEKIKASKQQGRSPAGEGKNSDAAGAVVPNLDQMSDDEIDALPAATLRRLRGDFM